MTQSYVTLRGILENRRKVLGKTTDSKKNCMGSNCVEDFLVNRLLQTLDEVSYDKKSD